MEEDTPREESGLLQTPEVAEGKTAGSFGTVTSEAVEAPAKQDHHNGGGIIGASSGASALKTQAQSIAGGDDQSTSTEGEKCIGVVQHLLPPYNQPDQSSSDVSPPVVADSTEHGPAVLVAPGLSVIAAREDAAREAESTKRETSEDTRKYLLHSEFG